MATLRCRIGGATLKPGETMAVVPASIRSMIDDGTPDPSNQDMVTVSLMGEGGFGELVALYDASGNILSGKRAQLVDGAWDGKAAIKPLKPGIPGGNFVDLTIEAFGPSGGGGGWAARFYFAASQPLPTDWVEFSDKGQVLWSGIRRKPLDIKVRTRDLGMIFPSRIF